jgi:hypothetical protein
LRAEISVGLAQSARGESAPLDFAALKNSIRQLAAQAAR